MNVSLRITPAVFAAALLLTSLAAAGESGTLGSTSYRPSPEQPVGWRGDWTGKFIGATPPLTWNRHVKGPTSELRYQADKPSDKPAAEPGKGPQLLEYFTIKDWLVAGPFEKDEADNGMDKDYLGGEAAVQPAKDAKADTSTWKYLRADVETQSRHECNNGTCGHTNVDFVFAFGKFNAGWPVKVQGDFLNKVAYAHTYILSPVDQKVSLQIPFSGKAGRFWLNGKPTNLDSKNTGKTFDAPLVKGWNRLLIKVSTENALDQQGFSKWMAAAYLTPPSPVSYETKNISWMTKMTGRSMSQPIIVGDRLFLGSGISDLMCLDKKTGKVLWIRSNTAYDALTPEERAAIPVMKEKIEPLVAKLNTANDELLAAINAAIFPQGLSSTQQAAVDAKAKAKITVERALNDAFAAVDRKKYPQLYQNEVSSSNAVPVSDGKHVFWACGGAQYNNFAYFTACFDLDGKRIWSNNDSSMSGNEHGNHASPNLVDGKLIYVGGATIIAYDAKTGKEVWRNKPNDWQNAGCCGASPLVVKNGGTSVIVSKKFVHSVADGTVIGPSKSEKIFTDQTTIFDNGMLYSFGMFQGHGKPPSFSAVKIAPNGKTDAVWTPDGKDVWMPVRHNTIAESYSVGSPLFVDGLLYFVDMSGGLTVLEPAAKKTVYRMWLDGYNRFNRYLYGVVASPTLAGKNIYITDDAGYTHVLQPGPQYKELARNVIENIHQSGQGGNPCKQESFYTSPYFEGKCMYLRGEEYLYCIEEK